MSSRYMVTLPSPIRSRKMSFIIHWKVAGELVSPKNMTVGSNSPRLVRKAAFSFVAFLDAYVVVSETHVELREVLGSAQFVNEFGD